MASEQVAQISPLVSKHEAELIEIKTANANAMFPGHNAIPLNTQKSNPVDSTSALISQQPVFRIHQGVSDGPSNHFAGGGLSDINMLLLDQKAHHISMSMQLHELQTQYRYASHH